VYCIWYGVSLNIWYHCLISISYNVSAMHDLYGNGVLVAFDQKICILGLRAISEGSSDNVQCFHYGLQGVKYMAVYATSYLVFYFDSIRKEIKSYEITTKIVKTLQTSTGEVSGKVKSELKFNRIYNLWK